MSGLFRKFKQSAQHHSNREEIETLCCLSVLGEISNEERIYLDHHLKTCQECRSLQRDLEQIAMFDLTAAATGRTERVVTNLDCEEEDRMLVLMIERLRASRNKSEVVAEQVPVPPCQPPSRKQLRHRSQWLYLATGCALAASLLLILGQIRPKGSPASDSRVQAGSPAAQGEITQLKEWKNRANAAEQLASDMREHIDQSDRRERDAKMAMRNAVKDILKLTTEKQSIEAQLAQLQDLSRQQSQELATTRADLDNAKVAQFNLEDQLKEVNVKLEKQRSEAAHLQVVAAKSTSQLSARQDEVQEGDARELIGARDLHIVDVYDVGQAGQVSKIYGRVYFVNHRSLLFYAFDLGENGERRKPVAFQAWGFRQPNSTTPENLGLFYLDDAKLDRWALRIVDPRILARIDTLFVTVEPPGGSHSPLGRKLLYASLAGPANHP